MVTSNKPRLRRFRTDDRKAGNRKCQEGSMVMRRLKFEEIVPLTSRIISICAVLACAYGSTEAFGQSAKDAKVKQFHSRYLSAAVCEPGSRAAKTAPPGSCEKYKSMMAAQRDNVLAGPAVGPKAKADCQADITRFCSDVQMGHGVARCLNQKMNDLSPACARRVEVVCKNNHCPTELELPR